MRLFKTKAQAEWSYDTGLISRIVAKDSKLTIYFSYWRNNKRLSPIVYFAKALNTYVSYYVSGGKLKTKCVNENRLEVSKPIPDVTLYLVGNHMPYTKEDFHSTGVFSKTPYEDRIDHIHICTKNKAFTTEEINKILTIANQYQQTEGKFSEVNMSFS